MNAVTSAVQATEYKTGFYAIGKRWSSPTYGTTYHTVEVHHDNQFLFKVEKCSGYGDQFLETAMQELEKRGLIAPRDRAAGTLFWRETLLSDYSVRDVKRMRDL